MKLDVLEESIFGEIADLLERVKNEMITNIVFYIADDVKARSRPYRNDRFVSVSVCVNYLFSSLGFFFDTHFISDILPGHFRWVGMPSPKELISPALSVTACEMMLVLRERLQHIEQLLAKQLFTTVWQKVAEVLNTFFYEEVNRAVSCIV